ncbi:LuxR C-terminal-related transcriptional regulator [Paenibacillus sp. PL2-23]|uniref:LuxR C-terminal-related transcriptional regulator n=1 Tax=Paenibacillus sp. PL2-23 TaxID=2100729 RepID=UPI0030FA5060
MPQTIGQHWNRLMADHFVGREFELAVFRRYLENLPHQTERILHLSGTAGMGKTYLLHRFAEMAGEHNALPVWVRMRELGSDIRSFEQTVLKGLEGEASTAARGDACGNDGSVSFLHETAEHKRIVLLIDEYEEAGALDYWLRTQYLPNLPSNMLIVIAGRYSLEGPWRFTPGWNRMIVRMPLADLSYEDIQAYLRQLGVSSELAADAVWLRTLGHPLAVSLLALEAGKAMNLDCLGLVDGEAMEALLERWLQEVPDDELRRLLFAASAVRTFQHELLEELLGSQVSPALFDRLIKLSFVGRTAHGWQLHEIVWESLRRMFRERMPELHERYLKEAAQLVVRKIEEGLARGKNIMRELTELLHISGTPVIRAHYRHSSSPSYREPLSSANQPELEAYIARRKSSPRAWNVICSSPEEQAIYRFAFTPEESLLRLSAIDWASVGSLPDEDRRIELLRNDAGEVAGVLAMVAISARTWSYLAASPVTRALFHSPAPNRQKELSIAADEGKAWYLLCADAESLENEQLRSDIVSHLFEYVLAGNLIAASVPPLAYYDHAFEGLGFERVPEAEHHDYGMPQPAQTYWLDTRQGGLMAYIRRITGTGIPNEETRQSLADKLHQLSELTSREKDVIGLIATGLTNAEIASALYISEAAVKKHVNTMLSKFGLKNRTQLARVALDAGEQGSC